MFKEKITTQELNQELKNYETTQVEKVLNQVDKILEKKVEEQIEQTLTTYSIHKKIEENIENNGWEKVYSGNTMRTDVLVGIRNLLHEKNLIEVHEEQKGDSSIKIKKWKIKNPQNE